MKNLNVGQFAAAVALGIVVAAALRTLVTVTPPKQPGLPPITPAFDVDRRIASMLADLPRACGGRNAIDPASPLSLAILDRRDTAGHEMPVPNGLKWLSVATMCFSCHGKLDEADISAEHFTLGTRAN